MLFLKRDSFTQKTTWFSLLFLSGLGFTSCGKAKFQKTVWVPPAASSAQSLTGAPNIAEEERLSFAKPVIPISLAQARSTQAMGAVIRSTQQEIAGAPIAGSFLKLVTDKSGSPTFIAKNTIPEFQIPSSLEERIKKTLPKKDFIKQLLKRTNSAVRNAKQIEGPKLEVLKPDNHGGWRLHWVTEYLAENEESFWKIEADEYGNAYRVSQIGSHFEPFSTDGKGIVFPKGPKHGVLDQVVFKNLFGDGTLNSPQVHMQSMLPEGAKSEQNIFQYDPTDSRFEDVQAYYYLDHATRWFKSEANLELPFSLDVKIYVGGIVEPKNTAYYYHGNMRFGAGDGKSYKWIQRDPSIVTHETCHAFIEAVSHLGYEGQNGSINEAYADFFAANILDNPNMGEVSYLLAPYKRTLSDLQPLSGQNGGLYHDSLIISSTLWDLRKQLGPQKAFALALRTLERLTPDSQLADFGPAVRLAIGVLSSDTQDLPYTLTTNDTSQIESLLKRQGWL